MNELAQLNTSLLNFLNYPLITIGKNSITIWTIVLTILLVAVFILVASKLKDWLLKAAAKHSGGDNSNWRVIITLSYYAFIALGLVGILQTTGLDLSIFTVLTGAIGIGVGFGMQTIFSNFISGVIILLEKPIKLGDRIEVGEVSGNVLNISVRATTILTNDNISIIVPNSDFISKQVINWSYSGHRVRTRISVGVSYDSDPELIEKLLLKVASEVKGVLEDPPPKVRLVEFGDSRLKFSLLVWTHEFADRMGALKSLLNLGVLKAFKENNVSMPFPQRELHVIRDENH
jgi:small-conductance mechanosensitive channel